MKLTTSIVGNGDVITAMLIIYYIKTKYFKQTEAL